MFLENVEEENYCVELQSMDTDFKTCCLVMHVVKINLALLTGLETGYNPISGYFFIF